MKLPILRGSTKQINWALSIRLNRLKVWEDDPKRKDISDTAFNQLIANTYAGWWIENRDKSLSEVARIQGNKPPLTETPKNHCVISNHSIANLISGGKVVETATGFIVYGPLRNIVTGEIEPDRDDIPF